MSAFFYTHMRSNRIFVLRQQQQDLSGKAIQVAGKNMAVSEAEKACRNLTTLNSLSLLPSIQ
jgi:hypothetical protein